MVFLSLSVKVNVSVLIQSHSSALITICYPIPVHLLHPYSISLHNKVYEAFAHPGWRSAMIKEMDALTDNGTWDLVRLPVRKKVIGC